MKPLIARILISPLVRGGVLAAASAAAACAGDGRADREPVQFDAPYAPPADRIDPPTAATWDDAAFRALGAARVAVTIGASERTTEHDNVLVDDPRFADPVLASCMHGSV